MQIEKTTLDNGLTSITVPMEDTPTATVLVMVNAGTRFETEENNGISHFLEHMCFKGTKNRPSPRDVSAKLDGLGAESNAFTGYEYTGYYAKTKSDNTQDVLEVLSDIYKHPLLSQQEIKKEAGVITEEIRMYEDLPMRKVHEVFQEGMFGDQPMGWSVLGPEENVQEFNKEDISNYREKLYVPEATTVVVVGGIDPDSAQQKIAKNFQDLTESEKIDTPPAEYRQDRPSVLFEEKESDQTHLVVGAPAVPVDSDKKPATEVLSTVLGRGMSSRLFHKLRDRMGVCYYVKSSVNYYSDNGVFKVFSGVDNSRVSEVVEAICKELQLVKNEEVGAEELKKAKEYLAGNFLMSHESTNKIATNIAEQSVLDLEIEKPKEYVERIENVTQKDVQEVANDLFSEGSLQTAIVGPEADKKEVEGSMSRV